MRSRLDKKRFPYVRALVAGVWVAGIVAVWFLAQHGTAANLLSFLSLAPSDAYQGVPRNVLASRLADAEEELARIRYQALLYSLAIDEVYEMRTQLGLPVEEVVARGRVVARPPQTHYDTLVVALGSGLPAIGDRAFVSGVAVGEVARVTDASVTVSLWSSPGSIHDARVGDPTAIVVVSGLGAGAFSFEIPKAVRVHPGEHLYTADGNVFATVVEVVDEPEQANFFVYAASPVSFSDMHVVEFTRYLPPPVNETP